MTRTRTRWHRAAVALAAAGTVALGVAACSSSAAESTSAPAGDSGVLREDGAPPRDEALSAGKAQGGARPAEQAGQPGAPAQAGAEPARAPQAPPTDAADQRSIIYTGTISVRVDNVNEAAGAAATVATGAGGFVGGDQRTIDDKRSRAHLVLRVPSARFSAVIDGVAALGREESRQLSTEDVTAKAVDLDARIATTQASVDRVRALLARAQNIGEIVSLESELARREADLESLKSAKRKLDDLTTLSTITLVLLGPDADVEKVAEPETGFLAGLKGGWRAFLASLDVLLTVLGALLPWLVALGAPAWVAVWLIRRLRRRART